MSQTSFRRSLWLIGGVHAAAIGGLLFFARCAPEAPKKKEDITWLDPAAAAAGLAAAAGSKASAPEASGIVVPAAGSSRPASTARATPTPRRADPESELPTTGAVAPTLTPPPTSTPRPTPTPTPTPRPTKTPPPPVSLAPTPTPTPKPKVTATPKPTPKVTKKPTPKPKAQPKPDEEEDEDPTPAPKKKTPTPKATPAPKSTPRPTIAAKSPSAAPTARPSTAPAVVEPKSLEPDAEPEPTVRKATRPEPGEGGDEEQPVRKAERPGAGGETGGSAAADGRGTSSTAKSAGGNRGADVGWYHSLIHDRFYAQWNQPTSISADSKFRTKLRIRILRDGTVASYSVARSSGNELMDQSVLDAASRVKRIEALPETLAKTGAYEVSIDFEMD